MAKPNARSTDAFNGANATLKGFFLMSPPFGSTYEGSSDASGFSPGSLVLFFSRSYSREA
jgi:hypothetical protein